MAFWVAVSATHIISFGAPFIEPTVGRKFRAKRAETCFVLIRNYNYTTERAFRKSIVSDRTMRELGGKPNPLERERGLSVLHIRRTFAHPQSFTISRSHQVYIWRVGAVLCILGERFECDADYTQHPHRTRRNRAVCEGGDARALWIFSPLCGVYCAHAYMHSKRSQCAGNVVYLYIPKCVVLGISVSTRTSTQRTSYLRLIFGGCFYLFN